MTDHGYVLYDRKSRRPLAITREQIEQNLRRATQAIVDLEAHIPDLTRVLDWDEEIERLLSTVPEFSATGDGLPEALDS